MRGLNIFIRHVHSGWMNAFVRGPHRYLLPVRTAGGSGSRRPEWPQSAVDVTPAQAHDLAIDAVVVQSEREISEFTQWLGGRRIGIDVPAIFLEHNAPQGRINEMQHPAARYPRLTLVHVTHFNALFWDNGGAAAHVIEHGIPDPGYRYTGELARCVVAINEPRRRARVTGTDLLEWIGDAGEYDLFGIGAREVPQDELHAAMARRRVYVHPYRWTSLGLTLLEAMHLGLPVIALATTEVPYAVPSDAGVVSNRIGVLQDAIRWLIQDYDAARKMGMRAREHALQHYGLHRFLAEWDALLAAAISSAARSTSA